jgi:hypothetical protein
MLNTNIARSNLAKLLATENLTVSYKKVETASFNLATRELILPIWNDVTSELYDLLVGHEVGHALDTPKKYMEDATKGGSNFAHFLNVVEDARIERNIKNRYPGLRKPMAIGYRQLVDRDFFGIKDKNVSSMLLIDRINLYFKVGAFSGATFSDVEQPFIKEIEDVISYEQVADIATRLYAYCKEELKEKEQQAQERYAMKQESGDDSEDDFSSDEDMDQDDDQEPSPVENLDPEDFDDGDQDSTEEDSEESTGSKMGNEDSTVEDYEGEVKSLTSEALEKNLKGLTETKFIQVGQAPSAEDFVLDEFVIPFKNLSFFEADFYTSEWFMPKMLSEFENKNKNAISYLVKEFELKKKAAELRRVTVADSGTLNTNMLHSYKFNDDIFRKIGSIAAGKNHGIVLFVDWSGSMVDNIQGTIEQLLTLTSFCRKVNIPFDVYAFTTNFVKSSFSQRVKAGGQKDTLELSPFGLMNILSSNMKNQTYKKFANDLLSFAFFQTNYYTEDGRRILGRDYIPETHALGGTPLNATIMVASEVVNAFRAKNKCEIVNVVFLTDGEDNDSAYTCGDRSRAYGYAENKIRITASNNQIVSFIEDKTTRKTYRVGSLGITPTLLTILKDRTQCNLIGFYIVTKSKRSYSFNPAALRLGVSLANCTGAYAAFCKDKFFSVTNYGYDEYFLIPGGNDLSTEDDSLEDIVGKQSTTARKLKGAFIQMNKGRLLNRVLLSKVIKKLA